MDKKDIYEHLAKIYLDASAKKTEEKKGYPYFKKLFFFSLAIIFALSLFLINNFNKDRAINSELALILQPDVAKINFNFDPAKKESYSVALSKLNLTKYKTLAFSAKRIDFNDKIALRIEFNNSFKENSEFYIKEIPNKWQEYKINFVEFKNITDWSEMQALSFIVEQWNAKKSHGIILIENVRFMK